MSSLAHGVKSVIFTVCILVRLYDKYRARCVEEFPAEVITALDTISAACDALNALNPLGPY